MKPFYIAILFSLCIILPVRSQSNLLDTLRVSKDFSNSSLNEIVENIEGSCPVRFYYDENDSGLSAFSYTGSFRDRPLMNILTGIFRDSPYNFVFLPPGNVIIVPDKYATTRNTVKVKYSDMTIIGDRRDRGKYHSADLSGVIRNGATGEPLVGVVVFSEESGKGSVTDRSGEYSITLKSGKTSIQFSSMGYETVVRKVELISSGELDLDLFEESVEINEVVVTSERPDKNVTQAQMGTVELTAMEIQQIPSLMGEADLIKSLTLMPGVQTVGEAAGGFNIRGGSIDQNLILVDGTSLFNTSHLFGFFSTIQPEVINGVTLYKGNIPARYGGRISSVMDIGIKETPVDRFTLNAGIGLINTRINTEIPIIRNKVSFVGGARSTYSDWLLNLIANPEIRESSAGYYDFIGKLKWQINRKNAVSFFTYQSSDRFNLANTTRYQYGNRLGNVRLQHIFSGKLFISLVTGYSEYELGFENEKYERDPDARIIRSGIQQINSRIGLTWIPFIKNTLEAGIDAVKTTIRPGEQDPLTEYSIVQQEILEPEQAAKMALYLTDEYSPVRWLGISLGIRYSYYRYLGARSVFIYDPELSRSAGSILDTVQFVRGEKITDYSNPEPRISVRFSIDEKSSLKTGYNHTVQYIQLLSNTSAVTPTDVWKLSDLYIQPLVSDQISIGYFWNFLNNTVEASLEMYYKKIRNLIDYKNGAVIIMNKHIESDIVNGSGKAYGIEVMIRKNSGRLTGWIGYTYSRTWKNTDSQFPEDLINRGNYYPASFDRPHDVSSSLQFSISRRWSISGNFIYSSGRPATMPEYQFEINGRKMVYFSDRNKYRLPDYHRLDLSVTYHGHLRAEQRYRSSWTFSLYNVYGRSNPYSVYYTKDQPTAANDYRDYVLYKLSIVDRPIPTISYNFRF